MIFEELLSLDSFSKANIVVENSDFSRRVENIYVADTMEFQQWIHWGDLVFFSGGCCQNGKIPLKDICSQLIGCGAAGIVIGTGDTIKTVPEDVIEIAKQSKFPIIALPCDESWSEVISEAYFELFRSQDKVKKNDSLMKELLFGDEQRALNRLVHFNYEKTRQHIVIFLSFDQPNYDKDLIQVLAMAVPINLSLELFSICYADEDGVIVALELSQKEPIKNVVTRIMSSVQNWMGNNWLKGNTISAGVSSIFYEPDRMKACIEEAKKAFWVLRGCNVRHAARYYEEIGIYRFFFEFQNDMELQDYVMEYLGELIRYDEETNGDFVATLEVYLDENCNIGKTSEKMFVHRNTIKNRILRIEEILGIDLNNANIAFNLRFAYKIKKYLGGKL